MSMNLAQLLNLDSYTKITDVTKNYHNIENNTLDQTNVKDRTDNIYDVQNGNKILGRDYDINNHQNSGYESFGLMNLQQRPQFT